MNFPVSTVLLLGLVATSGAARAQCVPLAQLLALGATTAPPTAAAATGVLPAADWLFRGQVSGSSKEIYWSFNTPGAAPDAQPKVSLSLRPTPRQGCDVVLKTAHAECVRQLRGELKDRKIKPEPVTCPECEAQRYPLSEAPGATATLYSGMKGPYPFVIVISGLPPSINSGAARTAGTNRTP